MPRTFDSQSMVVLPSLDSGSASTLAGEVILAANQEGKHLSDRILDLLADLVRCKDALDLELTKTLPTQPAGGTVADPEREESAAWSAAEKVLEGLMAMPSDSDKPIIAARLYHALFSEGVTFLRGTPHKRWAEAQKRIEFVHQHGLAREFASIDCEELLATIESKHAAVGVALGFTVTLPAPVPPQIRTTFDNLLAALRELVFQVAASANKKKPATVALAKRLLAPVTTYVPPPRAKATKPPAGEAPPADKDGKKNRRGADKKAGEKKAETAGDTSRPPPATQPPTP